MEIIRDYQFVSASDQGATAAIGNFDGVHPVSYTHLTLPTIYSV